MIAPSTRGGLEMHSSPVAARGKRPAWLLPVLGALVIAVAGALFASFMAERARVAAAHTAYAESIEPSCRAITAYEMSLDTASPDDAGVVVAAWARLDAVPVPSPLAPAVADARARVAELVRGGGYTTSPGADDLAAACAALVSEASLVAGPPAATMLGGPS